MWFLLRSPELAEDFERLMREDRDIVRGSLDTVSDWRPPGGRFCAPRFERGMLVVRPVF
jgi:hypothetical protein